MILHFLHRKPTCILADFIRIRYGQLAAIIAETRAKHKRQTVRSDLAVVECGVGQAAGLPSVQQASGLFYRKSAPGGVAT